MKKILMNFALILTLSLFSAFTFGQRAVKGVVVDAKSGETLLGATVVVEGVSGGTVTDIDGSFTINVPAGEQTIAISFIGYIEKKISINDGTTDLGTIIMEADAIGIAEIGVIASIAIDRKTPVAVSSIDPVLIDEKLGTQEYPEILKSTPSVYATKQGGGYGDARINVRGFDARNVAVMINGVPVNDMENGWVYWSNWAGLADATRSVQVQRGLGASKVAVPSIGGTINILTKTTDVEKGGNVSYAVGNDAYEKMGFTVSTGLNDNGWAFTASASKTTGNGYVDGTEFEAYSYYANLSKQINDKQRIAFSVVGAPQWHGQRSSSMSIEEFKEKGIKYNPDWGYRNGEVEYLRKNFYHKPQAIFNHFWNLSSTTDITTAIYASIGTGGGTGNYGENGSKFYSYKVDDQIDFDRIIAENQERGDLGSDAILRSSNNNHHWYGMLTNVRHDLENGLVISGGIDLRYYKGEHYREVIDLLGGKYLYDDSDVNEPTKIAQVGDKIAYHNDGLVGWAGAFGQAEYTMDALTIFAAASFSSVASKRVDYFNYDINGDEYETDWQNYLAYSTKGGANYNLTENHNVFVNAGYFERQPDFDAIFLNYVNDINPDAQNEKILSFELGYGFRSKNLKANFNVYNTDWKDKTFTPSFRQPDGEYFTANMLGVNAIHRGAEFDFRFTPTRKLTVTGMLSLSDWKWKNNLEDVTIVDENQNEIGVVNLFIKDVPVGDAAQTTAAFGINYKLLKDVKIGIDYNYYDRLFAKFDPTDGAYQSEPADGVNIQPWQMPAYHLLDLNVRYSFKIGDLDATLFGKVNNLLDIEYMSDGFDGADHDWTSAKVYYGYGRTWSMRLKINF